jgi:glycerophosphoryl diester phosphodiesterase
MNQTHPAYMPRIIGHRGACGSAPENTLVSIRRAAEMGAKAVEVDATVSSDGIALLVHDTNLDRCSNGQGPVVLRTAAEIGTLDAGSWFASEFRGESIPRLEQALALVVSLGIKLNLEIKPTLGWEEVTVHSVAETLQQAMPPGMPILVSSMNLLALELFHALMPDMSLGLITTAAPKNWLQRLQRYHCQALHCHHAFASHELVDDIHAHGYRIHVYTVNDEGRARELFAMGVDAIFTDYPDRMLSLEEA